MRTEDGEIIYKCLNEDSTAFGLLVDKYKGSIFAIAYSKLRNFHDAEDVTQDVFLKAYKNLRKLKRWDNFLAWLCSIAYNLCRDRIKSQAIHIERLEQKAQETLDNPINTYRQEQVYESLHEALNSLPDIYRDVLTLHYLGGISGEQIARILSLPHSTVRQRLSRARTQLREELLAMISETFEQEKLRANFTFRIVEMVKKIRIHPISTIKGLPWGLSLATGIIFTIMSLNPYIPQFSQVGAYIRSVLPSETKVLNVGEIPVDVVKASNIAILSNEMGKGKGGESKQHDENAFFMAPQAEGGEWIQKASMPTPRLDLDACVVDGIIYAIGGCQNGPGLSTVEAYNPKTDIWTKKADMPTARTYLSTCLVDGMIYAIGGMNAVGGSILPIVEAYNPKTDTWTKKRDMPTARAALSTSLVDGIIYAIGGWNGIDVIPVVEVYNPKTDTWKTGKSDMLILSNCHAACVVKGMIYIIGGWVNGGPIRVVEVYDPKSDNWILKEGDQLPPDIFNSEAVVINKTIYAFTYDGILLYDLATDSWTEQNTPMPTFRGRFRLGEVNGKIYAIGGGLTKGVALDEGIVEEYTPEGWTVSPNGKMPSTWGTLKAK